MQTTTEQPQRPPLAPGLPLIGPLSEMSRDPIGLLQRSAEALGDTVQFKFGPQRITLLRHPDDIHRVLVANHKNYGKQNRAYNVLRRLLGDGLFTSSGSFWKRQRRIAQPSFHHQRIQSFAATMTRVSAEMLSDWDHAALTQAPLDVSEEMMRLTLRIATLTLLGQDPRTEAAAVAESLTILLEMSQQDISAAFTWPTFLPTPRNRRWNAALARLDQIVYGIISARRAEAQLDAAQTPDDLLSMLMAAKDEETGESMSDLQLRDEVMTMFLAGHETTANALTWLWHLVSAHPLVGARLQDEVSTVLAGSPPSVENIQQLAFTEAVIKETLRLYPPAWLFARSVEQDDVVGGYQLRKGEHVFISPYLTQRHPALWEEPNRFNPDRFMSAATQPSQRCAFLPFGAGPRVCIGNAFAMLELKLIVAVVCQRFTLSPCESAPPELAPMIALRPREAIRVTLARVATGI